MKHRQVASVAQNITGGKLYQERARRALPLLIRQARAARPIYYANLAEELDMPNPRNLDYVLGSIGKTLLALSKQWKLQIPPLQSIVINQRDQLPGNGVAPFIVTTDDFALMSRAQRREVVRAYHARIFAYPRWNKVLEALDITQYRVGLSAANGAATGDFGGGGETEAHYRLKHYVALNPAVLDQTIKLPIGECEVPLPSGDTLDVSFRKPAFWFAAEVKSLISGEADILRGLYQCVKYGAVLEAVQIAEDGPRGSLVVLVLEGKLPVSLLPLKNALSIAVIENVKVPPDFVASECAR